MTDFVYRFRSARALLETFDELEKQQIYFARLRELNDPLEGFKDVVWQGDAILWSNLLRHYLLCLTQAVIVAMLGGADYKFGDDESYVFMTENTLPTAELKQLYGDICERFFARDDAAVLAKLLASRAQVRRNELILYLRTLHFRAVDTVLSALEASGHIPQRPVDNVISSRAQRALGIEALVNGLNQLPRDSEKPGAEIFSMTVGAAASQVEFISAYNSVTVKEPVAWRTILVEFPTRHVEQLDRLMFPGGYTACFVRDPMQASMWGVYADSHRGVSLKFRTHNNSAGKPCIRLKTATGLSGGRGSQTRTVYDNVLHELHEVAYAPRFVQIDFFRSLGVVTMPMLNRWYRDSAGIPSDGVLDIIADSKEWRTQYWETYRKSMTTKLEDWRHESEVRCALHSSIVDLTEKPSRKLEYDFAELEGVIFGLQTSNEDKIKIARIVESKCRESGRKHFEFRQAYYAPWSGKMDSTELSLLTFS